MIQDTAATTSLHVARRYQIPVSGVAHPKGNLSCIQQNPLVFLVVHFRRDCISQKTVPLEDSESIVMTPLHQLLS